MTKIKICGLSRPDDIVAVNAARPDYCGFVIGVPSSRRNVSADAVRRLAANLDPSILPVGVFADAPVGEVAALLNEGVVAMAQLHGHEDNVYLEALRGLTCKPLLQAFRIASPPDLKQAADSMADYILLDSGAGSGKPFDWSLLGCFPRPFFLAGGLHPGNIPAAIDQLHPYAVDLSSGVETDGLKDSAKIQAAVAAVRR